MVKVRLSAAVATRDILPIGSVAPSQIKEPDEITGITRSTRGYSVHYNWLG
jgi:hypothetical protein